MEISIRGKGMAIERMCMSTYFIVIVRLVFKDAKNSLCQWQHYKGKIQN
jgi:hypothetical protein